MDIKQIVARPEFPYVFFSTCRLVGRFKAKGAFHSTRARKIKCILSLSFQGLSEECLTFHTRCQEQSPIQTKSSISPTHTVASFRLLSRREGSEISSTTRTWLAPAYFREFSGVKRITAKPDTINGMFIVLFFDFGLV